MELSNWLIVMLLFVVAFYLFSKQGKRATQLKASDPKSLLYWHLLDGLNNENLFAPWEQVLTSTIVDLKDLHAYQEQVFWIWREECKASITDMDERKCFEEDIAIVYWSSSQDSWNHLAGRSGYILVSKKEKRQLHFLTTMVS